MFFLAQLVCVIWLGLLVFQHGMASWPAG
jgi:hypothetical protein